MRMERPQCRLVPTGRRQCANSGPVWTAPVVKGFFEVLWTFRERSCLRPVDAERMNSLALMICPRGSSPHHSVALVLALTAIRASEPLPLVHIISSTPSMLIALAAKTPIE